MVVTVDVTEDQVFQTLRAFLIGVLPAGTEVIRAQVNRVPEPKVLNFVVMTPTIRTRLATNVDMAVDSVFEGTVAGFELTVTSIELGAINLSSTLFSVNGAVITSQLSGTPAGLGVYRLSTDQSGFSGTVYAGVNLLRQEVQQDIQLDVHGPASADNTQIITTVFRDEYATTFFENSGVEMQALFTSEPHQVPFINGESQWENRWTFDLSFQLNPTVQISQEFADKLAVGLINVDVVYPP